MEITIPQIPGHVGLRIFQAERSLPRGELDYFTVEIADSAIRAVSRVYAFRAEGIVDLFEEMAREWRGWSRLKEWESLEGEFRLSCSSDGKGHVAIGVVLRPSAYPTDWCVHATAFAEAGQLDRLAATVRTFFLGDSE